MAIDNEMTIKALQAIATGLSAQSFGHRMHAKVFASQGFSKLGEKYAEHADEEMGFVEQFIDRIIDLGGQPALEAQPAGEVHADIVEYLKSEKKVSEEGISQVAVMMAPLAEDFITYDLIKEYLKDEDGDLQETNQELELIEAIGKQNWLATQL